MRTLPKVVASTEVGKSVELKIWRNKKLISKRLILGRLESSEEFKEKKTKVKTFFVKCGVRTHAHLRVPELKSAALDRSANLT